MTDLNKTTPSLPGVSVVGVYKRYADAQPWVVEDACLTLAAGEFVALMGPSGCGKSTLLNLMAGLDMPTRGEILIAGQPLNHMNDDTLTRMRRTQIGFVFQAFNLLNTLTVAENVRLPLDLAAAEPVQGQNGSSAETSLGHRQRRVETVLEQVGLTHRQTAYPSMLSGGEMQRVAIARAIIHQPRLLLADEPTGNLDSENGQSVLALLQSLNQTLGQTILMVTHSEEAAAVASRCMRMKDGRLQSP
ncbi:MAG: ABC transporter ATP-binding protein [Candidatus Melainabacteria bacterium]|nr:ABC transporter ATP-binding protein [Candidatus Melainabacteria bacterium]